mmetsp:Transcript_76595/g.169285  ORF Transcript_76595/g.169285 Transcript_76595/m.169285 type:complete len:202 (+) Transcript_76595:104-709(+)
MLNILMTGIFLRIQSNTSVGRFRNFSNAGDLTKAQSVRFCRLLTSAASNRRARLFGMLRRSIASRPADKRSRSKATIHAAQDLLPRLRSRAKWISGRLWYSTSATAICVLCGVQSRRRPSATRGGAGRGASGSAEPPSRFSRAFSERPVRLPTKGSGFGAGAALSAFAVSELPFCCCPRSALRCCSNSFGGSASSMATSST